jgi:hypothetical protein
MSSTDDIWILHDAARLGVYLRLDGEALMAGPKENITPELRQRLKDNRPEVVKTVMLREAHEYLQRNHVEGADLSMLDDWHGIIGHAHMSGDPELFRIALRGYTRAGLMAFKKAKRERQEAGL